MSPEAYGKNLANVFPFFDWMFGTYRVPGPCNAPLGATDIPRNDVVRLTLWPLLEWARLATQSVAALRARIAGWLARDAGTAPGRASQRRRGIAVETSPYRSRPTAAKAGQECRSLL